MVRFKKEVFFLYILILGVSVFFFGHIEFEGNLTGNLIKKSPFYQTAQKIESLFGTGQQIQVKAAFDDENLQTVLIFLEKFRVEVKKLGVQKIEALDDFKDYFYLENVTSDQEIFNAFKKLSNLPYAGRFLSTNFQSTQILITPTTEFDYLAFDHILTQSWPGVKSLTSMGFYRVESTLKDYVKKDLVTLMSAIFFITSLSIYVVFRSFSGLLFCLLMLVVGLYPVIFLFSILKIKINILTLLVFPIVLVLTLSDSIHLLTGLRNSFKSFKRVQDTLERYFVPSFLTSLTTAIAFFSFMINDIENLKNFGLVTFVSTILSFIATFSFAPLAMEWVKFDTYQSAIMSVLSRFLQHHSKVINKVLLAMFFVALPFSSQLKFETQGHTFFPKNSSLLSDHEELRNDFGSLLKLYLLIEGAVVPDLGPDYYFNHNYVQEMTTKIHLMLRHMPEVSHVSSAAGPLIYYMKDPLRFKNPQSIDMPRPYQKGMNQFLIEVTFKDSDKIIKLYNDAKDQLEKVVSGVKVSVTSPRLIFNELDLFLSKNIFISLLFSLGCILYIFYLMTLSVPIALMGVFANLVPLASIVLLLYLTGASINVVTAMSAVICLGVVVDDTIHVIYRTINKKEHSLQELSEGMLTTSIVLSLGFGMFLFSHFLPTRIFGLISSTIFIVAVISDISLLPEGIKKLRSMYEK